MDPKKHELQQRIDTLKFALQTPGVDLKGLASDACKVQVKAMQRRDIQDQIEQAEQRLLLL